VTAPRGSPRFARDGSTTRQRIIDATIDCVARDGATEASMATIAAEAGVSKALLHYHYSDRARLLAEVVMQLGDRLAAREREALTGADGSKAVDALWRWLESELALGELRVLLELSLIREPLVHDAAATVADARRIAAGRMTADLLRRLGIHEWAGGGRPGAGERSARGLRRLLARHARPCRVTSRTSSASQQKPTSLHRCLRPARSSFGSCSPGSGWCCSSGSPPLPPS
jgi:AcrR family transcriptional regulator